jgi:hypothetical protein
MCARTLSRRGPATWSERLRRGRHRDDAAHGARSRAGSAGRGRRGPPPARHARHAVAAGPIAPIIKRGNIDGWQMRAPAWSCRRTLPLPGRVAAAAWFWPRCVPGRGPGLGVPEGLAHEPAWLCDPGSSRIGADLPIRLGPGWRRGAAGAGWQVGRGAEPLTDGRGRVLVVLGCGAAGSGMAPFPSASGERCRAPATAAIAADRDAQAEGTARR